VEESGLRKWDPKIVESEKGAPGDGKPGGAKGKQKGAPPGAKRGEKRRKVADIAPPTAELPRETGKEPAVIPHPHPLLVCVPLHNDAS